MTETLSSRMNDNEITTPAQRAMRQAFESTAHLANHLPTGTVLAFQILSPVLTNRGRCTAAADQTMTAYFLALCALSCFFASFTDSVRDEDGNVRYGIATFKGLWMIDGSTATLPSETAVKYKLVFVDFVHAITAVLVFAAVALFDQNVVSCFFPVPSPEMRQTLGVLPVGIGVLGSMLFVNFPTTRHGIGFRLSPQ